MAETKTLRSGISDLVNDLQKALMSTTDVELQEKIHNQVRALMLLWQEVIFAKLDKTTAEYKSTIKALDESKADAALAAQNIQSISAALEKAAKVIRKLDKLLGFTAKLVGKKT